MNEISKTLRDRWSPRDYDPTAEVTEEQVTALLEAARWAPSAHNLQPWKFIVGVRGDEAFQKLEKHLIPDGGGWAADASVLVLNIADKNQSKRHAAYDLNAAVQHMVLQAETMGLKGRVFVSFDKAGVIEEFGLAEGLYPYSMTAIGIPTADAVKPERVRKPISEIRIG